MQEIVLQLGELFLQAVPTVLIVLAFYLMLRALFFKPRRKLRRARSAWPRNWRRRCWSLRLRWDSWRQKSRGACCRLRHGRADPRERFDDAPRRMESFWRRAFGCAFCDAECTCRRRRRQPNDGARE